MQNIFLGINYTNITIIVMMSTGVSIIIQ